MVNRYAQLRIAQVEFNKADKIWHEAECTLKIATVAWHIAKDALNKAEMEVDLD